MEKQNVFKWKHDQPDIILLTVRWYLRYNLSFRDLVEMMEEWGLFIAHTTIMRLVHQYGPELDKRIRRHLKQINDSWRVDETYIKVKGQWMYLYRAVDSEGNTVEFMPQRLRIAVPAMDRQPSDSSARLCAPDTLWLRVLSTLTRTPLTLRLL